MNKEKIKEIIESKTDDHGMYFIQSRMISGSKSLYTTKFPDNIVIFNSNIIVKGVGKVWYGDLDITMDKGQLTQMASEIGKNLYILREMDGRFGNENEKIKELIKKAAFVVTPQGVYDNKTNEKI